MGKAARKMAVLKAYAREWGQWKNVELTDELCNDHPLLEHCKAIWENQRYEVQAFSVQTSIGGVWQLSIIRHSDLEPISWGEIQRIVHELYGPEVTAVELYPPLEAEWKTHANPRQIWVMPLTWERPFGLDLPGAWGSKA